MMAEIVHCAICGSPNPLGVSKCTTCGSPLGQSNPRNNPAYSKVFSNTKMAVFDIDDTILDVSERFRSARRAGVVNDQGGPVRKGMNSGWQKRNDFLYREDMLDKDRVIAGSKDLISYLMKQGYSIAYCTARDAKNREKTKVQLENKGFPLFKDDRGEVLLFLKEGARRRMKGPAYKADVVSMLQGKYDVRLFFDDNKDNLIAVASLGVPGIYEKVSDYWKMVSARKNPHDIENLKKYVTVDEELSKKYDGTVVTGTADPNTAYLVTDDTDAEEVWDMELGRYVPQIIAETSAPPVEEDRGSIQKRINPPLKPRKKGTRKEPAKNYIKRFMRNDKMLTEFPREDQRYAVALSYVEKFYGKAARDRIAPVRTNPASPDKVKKGEKLYEHMNGKAPAKKTTEMIDIGDVWYQVGEGGCWQIGYMSGKETGKSSQKYVHTFNEETQDGNFPKLYATIPENGKPMLIIKGGTWKIKTDKEGVAWIYD